MLDKSILDNFGYIRSFSSTELAFSNTSKSVKFIACGDTGPIRNLEKVVMRKGSSYVLGEVKSTLRQADFVFANLETTFSNRGKPMNRSPVFRLNPESFDIIKYANIKVVSLANNHMFDYGPEAFIDTVELLRKNDISYFGAGLTFNDALCPLLIRIKGLKFGFLGFRDKESRWSDRNEVVTPEIDEELILNCVKQLRGRVDFVILSLHFGWEYQLYPSPRDVKLCRKFIDAGVDIILGHHPHYPQGIERYNNGVISYSLGNFIWDQNFVGHTNSSYFLEIELTKEKVISVKVTPFELTQKYTLKILQDSDSYRELNHISSILIDEESLNEKWYFISRNKFIEMCMNLIHIVRNHKFQPHHIKAWLKILLHPHSRYTLKSLFTFVASGKAMKYEFEKKLKTRHSFND